ncbi:hypothetical protein GWO43_23115 [candidate division KSB1 bacterium]|nr:hypothetical protein [candidate division KSB1 bacterium]NIV70796.1 hypothetical protein [Phycisphaerae bacterium]NIR72914.1 hypothetical protein [candidate division KSB1 bacterium]NIT73712.1 hypothetical protein [candidate division KSB1 bacterium]NIU27584.1 hypothetical protein [candidate division KSB1 bacterium]
MEANFSSDLKAQILSAIRNARSLARLTEAKSGLSEKPVASVPSKGECLNRFRTELAALGVDTYFEEKPEAIRKRLASLLEGKSILSWDLDHLPYDVGEVLQDRLVLFGHDDEQEQATAEIGLTGCDAAIAETGSLVLISAEGKPRTASLLPFEYIAIVSRSEIYSSMGDFFEKRGADIAAASYLNIITGPSRTADIELSLTLGVHGPGKVSVVIGP